MKVGLEAKVATSQRQHQVQHGSARDLVVLRCFLVVPKQQSMHVNLIN